jgi:predicted small lipoprotein YifL
MVRAARHILFLTVTAVLLSGCGLKGPLYLPEERAKQQAESERQKKDRSTNTPGSSSTAPAVPTDTTHPPSSPTPPPENPPEN